MTWHPILSATEVEPAHWVMIDSLDHEYGDVQLRRTADGLRYRAEYRGKLIGWGVTLADTCSRIHQAYLDSHGPQGGAYTSAEDWKRWPQSTRT
ncbi:MAG: hypothetical protein LBE05_05630 [Microbacterium sp.]|jgi:hypothetical protein|nr:hypothetical protein [Microbacterium sp.]